jgi:hypothetical protein
MKSTSLRQYVEARTAFEELPPGLELEVQEGLTTSTPARGRPPSPHHDSDRNTRRTLEEPTPCSLLEPLNEDSGGGSDDNVSELEKGLLLAFKEQEKPSSVSPPSSARPPRHSFEPSHPQIDQVHNQSGTSYDRLEELGYGFPLGSQDREEEPQEQQEQQEVEAMREEDYKDVEDDEDPRPAKRQKLRSPPAYEGLPPQPQNLTPPSTT